MQSTRYNKEYFKRNAIPDGMISVLTDKQNLREIESKWTKKFKGKPHKLGFINAEAKFQAFAMSNRDMEWLEGQKWYMHLVFAAYGVSPAEAGFYDDVNRASQEGQERITVKNAVKPYLHLIEKRLTADIIPNILMMPDCPLKFKFFPTDHTQEKEAHTQAMAEITAGTMTINEYRAEKGRDPVEWGDEPPQKMNMSIDSASFGNKKDDEKKPEREKDREDKPKEENKEISKEVTKGDDIVEESEDYDNFLFKIYDEWEKDVVKSLSATDFEHEYQKSNTKTINKNFSILIANLFSKINTIKFFDQLKKYIKEPMMKGHDEAEKELDLNVEVSIGFEKKSEFFAQQQLNGYVLPSGKRWHGIKGASQELQLKIYDQVSEGVANKESQSQITQRVKETFKGAKDVQAKRIARTETNRFINAGKNQAFIESGVEGTKIFRAHIDSKTSEICKRLNKQQIPFDSEFKDPKTNITYAYPPCHPNCRSTIQFRI